MQHAAIIRLNKSAGSSAATASVCVCKCVRLNTQLIERKNAAKTIDKFATITPQSIIE